MQQRDVFIDEIYYAAERDSNIMFLSADFGSPSLDIFREKLPSQFVHCGISEQNMVNVAVGLALAGKKPYLYAMSPFFLRAYEQLKMAAMHNVPITVISVGAGLSYAGSGPTHYATEDVACYRTLVDTEVYTASTNNLSRALAQQSLASKKMMVVRLERGESAELYPEDYYAADGYSVLRAANDQPPCIASGYLVHWLMARGKNVIDLYRQKPISPHLIMKIGDHAFVHCYEEQYAAGGMGAALMEALGDAGKKTRVIRHTLPERALYENGTRDELLEGMWT